MSGAIGRASHLLCTTTLRVKVNGIGIKGSGLDHIAEFSNVLLTPVIPALFIHRCPEIARFQL